MARLRRPAAQACALIASRSPPRFAQDDGSDSRDGSRRPPTCHCRQPRAGTFRAGPRRRSFSVGSSRSLAPRRRAPGLRPARLAGRAALEPRHPTSRAPRGAGEVYPAEPCGVQKIATAARFRRAQGAAASTLRSFRRRRRCHEGVSSYPLRRRRFLRAARSTPLVGLAKKTSGPASGVSFLFVLRPRPIDCGPSNGPGIWQDRRFSALTLLMDIEVPESQTHL